METIRVWQITEFTDQIRKAVQEKFEDDKITIHYNTVDKWFKELESKHIHYVNRAAGEKIYDELDFQIGCHILEHRQKNWRLSMIFDSLQNIFELRPFPEGEEGESLMPIDEAQLVQRIAGKVEERLSSIVAKQLAVVEEKMNEQIQGYIQQEVKGMLPSPIDEGEIEKQKKREAMFRIKMELDLEEEAIKEWNKLPESERTKRVGVIFKKSEEDFIKRDQYIREYKRNKLKEDHQ